MATANTDQIRDGMSQWASAMSIYASTSANADTTRDNGLAKFWADSRFTLWNGLMLDEPVGDNEKLLSHLEHARSYMRGKVHTGLLYVCPEETTGFDFETTMVQCGFVRRLPLVGMELSELPPAPSASATELDVVRVLERKVAHDFANVIAEVFRTDISICRAEFVDKPFWRQDAFAYVAYLDREPVSVSTVIQNGDALYVGLVCTREQFRGRGYSYATNRFALADAHANSALERAFLHASQLGIPVYEKLGFQSRMHVVGYALSAS